MAEEKYAAQKKYLSASRKQLRVWIEADKFEEFQKKISENGTSMYAVINEFVNKYCEDEAGE